MKGNQKITPRILTHSPSWTNSKFENNTLILDKGNAEGVLLYFEESVESITIELLNRDTESPNQSFIEVGRIEQVLPETINSRKLSDIENICSVKKIKIVLDNSVSMNEERRLAVVETINLIKKLSDYKANILTEFYSLTESELSILDDASYSSDWHLNYLKQKPTGTNTQWVALQSLPKASDELNIFITDGIPNGLNGTKTDLFEALTSLKYGADFHIVSISNNGNAFLLPTWHDSESVKKAVDKILKESCESLEKNSTSTIEVYPNPSGPGLITVQGVENEKLDASEISLSIFDFTGRLIEIKNCSLTQGKFSCTLNLASYASGMYFVQSSKGNSKIFTVN